MYINLDTDELDQNEEIFIRSVEAILENCWNLLKNINPALARRLKQLDESSVIITDFHVIESKSAYLKAIADYCLILFRMNGEQFENFREDTIFNWIYNHFSEKLFLNDPVTSFKCLQVINYLSVKNWENKLLHSEDYISGLCSKIEYGIRLVSLSSC